MARKASVGALLSDEKQFIHSTTPKVGDIASWEGHIGIVSAVDEKTGKFKLIHAANPRDDILENPNFATAVQYRSSTFYGFYRPVVETEEGKTIDITKEPVDDQLNVNLNQSTYVEPPKPTPKSKSSTSTRGTVIKSGASTATETKKKTE